MEINKLHLFITIAQNCPKMYEEGSSPSEIMVDTMLSDIHGDIIQYKPNCSLKPNIIEPFWKENVLSIVVYNNFIKNDISYTTLLYLLKPEALTKLTSSENLDALNFKLLQETFPAFRLQYNPDDYVLMFIKDNIRTLMDFFVNKAIIRSYLIVFPSKDEIKNYDHSNISQIELINNFESSINRSIKTKVQIPLGYIDFIETVSHHFIYSQVGQLRIFIALSSSNKDRIVIPRSIKQIIDLDIILHQMEVLVEHLKTVYLLTDNVKSYIDNLSKKNVFSNYSSKYKIDRLSYIQTKFNIIDKIREMKEEFDNMPANSSIKFRENCLIKGITRFEASYSYALHERNLIKFETSYKWVEETLQNISNKDVYINEYIRDVISIESIWGNLKIQKILKRLNYFIIGLGIASLMASIYSTEFKRWISNLVIQLLKG